VVPRIGYVPIEQLIDPELRGFLHHAARHGTPRPESQAIRAHCPDILRAFSHAWEGTFRQGVCDHAIKELCRLYVSKTADCPYCGSQRSEAGRRDGITEDVVSELADFESSERFEEREKAALAYARAIAWNPAEADHELWSLLHEHFTDEELIELGWFIALTLGQQRWLKTLQIDHGQVMSVSSAGLTLTGLHAQ
jgi:AhpD family alkylhydroperoxidase